MQINEEYWGGADKRQTINGIEYTTYDLMTALNNGDIPFNEPLDTSISPWSINGAADAVGLAYPMGWRIGEENKAKIGAEFLNDDVDSKVNGVPFYFAVPNYSGNGGFNFNWFARNGYSQATIQDTTENTFRDKIYPVTNFDYSRFAYYLQLVVADYPIDEVTNANSFWSTSLTDMNTYFGPNYDSFWKNKPILGIRMVPYYAANEDYPNNRTAVELIMNSIGLKKPMLEQGPGLNGYDVDYIDDFMTLNKGNVNTSAASIGTYGMYAYYVIAGDGNWATNAGDALQYNYYVSNYNLQITHVGDGNIWEIVPFWTGTATIYYRTELRSSKFADENAFKDYILKQAAYYGTWFCLDAINIQNTAPGSTDNWYIGEIGSDGITTGNYEKGSDTSRIDNSTWKDPWEDSGWKGRSEDPNKYDKDLETKLSTQIMIDDPGTVDYIMTVPAFKALVDKINEKYQEIVTDAIFSPEQKEIALYAAFGTTDNPLTLIKVANRFPFDLGTGLHSSPTDTVRIGNYEVTLTDESAHIGIVEWNSIVPDYPNGFLYGFRTKPSSGIQNGINYYQNYKSFLDYEPYCSATLMVPWCGSIKIDPELFVGHQIRCEYVYDVYSGACTASIFRDKLVVDKITGSIGAPFNITSLDFTATLDSQAQARAYQRAEHENIGKILSDVAIGGVTVAATVATAGTAAPITAGALASGMAGKVALGAGIKTAHDIHSAQVAADNYHVKPAGVSFKQLGSDEGMLGLWRYEKKLRLNITRPTFLNGYTRDNFGDYGHTVGFACLKYETLNNFSGLTVCGSVDLNGVAATSQEIEMIRKALQTGVYLPAPTPSE